jgi:hypothetical protein
MSLQRPSNREVDCELTVLVTRDAAGDLVDGVRERLRRVDGVADVGDVDVRGLTPGLNDLRVEATVRLRLRDPPDDAEGVEATLESGFGVRAARLVPDRDGN